MAVPAGIYGERLDGWIETPNSMTLPLSLSLSASLIFVFVYIYVRVCVCVFVCLLLFWPAKVTYGKSLANVDWLHGSAEALLTITNILIGMTVVGDPGN